MSLLAFNSGATRAFINIANWTLAQKAFSKLYPRKGDRANRSAFWEG